MHRFSQRLVNLLHNEPARRCFEVKVDLAKLL